MKVCTNASIARKKHGDRMAELLHQRVDELKAADSVEQMIQFGIGRCHPLCGDRKGQYAVDLVHHKSGYSIVGMLCILPDP